MKRGRELSKGFTIVETLIFLAVTSAILASALTLVSGAQNKAEFNQAINDVNQKISDTFNNVASGYYPYTKSASENTCKIAGGEVEFILGATPQGGSNACLFLGRAIQFTTGSEYIVHTVAGRREISTGKPVTEYGDANAVVVTDAGGLIAGFPDMSEKQVLKNGLTLKSIKMGASTLKGVAVLSKLGELVGGSTGELNSGSQITFHAPITGSLGNGNDTDIKSFYDDFKAQSTAYDTVTSDPVVLCFDSGGTKQHGTISIGTAGQQGSTNLKVEDGNCP